MERKHRKNQKHRETKIKSDIDHDRNRHIIRKNVLYTVYSM